MAKSPLNSTQQLKSAQQAMSCNSHPQHVTNSEQYKRIVSAAVILPPLILFLAYAPRELFLGLICIIMGMSLYEYFRLLPVKHAPMCIRLSYALAFALVCTAYLGGLSWMPVGLSLSILLFTLSAILIASPDAPPFPILLHSLFGFLLIGWGLSHLVLLHGLETGKWYILYLCVIIWVGDATAMYVGKALGRHKLAPSISPGKTWEGSLGGILSCALVAVLSAHFFAPQLSVSQSLIFGLVVSIAAQVSDLGESMLKRYAGVKDSGALIPGHGGILDRIDSLFFAAPLAFYTLNLLTTMSSSS